MEQVVIIDYGMGNVGSVKHALEALGYDAKISASAEDIRNASHLILPGVGAFRDGMQELTSRGLIPILTEEVIGRKKPILGICLGMQLFMRIGEEGGTHAGLGWIDGITRRFHVDETRFKIPHVGWNDVAPRPGRKLFSGVKRPIFYFVHSYHAVPDTAHVIAADGDYGEPFAAALEQENIFGVQFHPEKSQAEGMRVLENFLKV